MSYEDDRHKAVIRSSLENERNNPAVRDAYDPGRWNEADSAEFVTKAYGTEEERIARWVEEFNRTGRN